MTNDSIFSFLWSCVQQVLQKAEEFKIYQGSGYSVSILQFFLSLAILSIVLRALLNFVQSLSIHTVEGSIPVARNIRNTYKELKGRDSNDVLIWMFE